jgi:hypothetical protein
MQVITLVILLIYAGKYYLILFIRQRSQFLLLKFIKIYIRLQGYN